MNILMAGCGQMGGAMLNKWVGLEGMSFTVVDPAPLSLPKGVWQETNVEALGGEQFDFLIVAVKPQMIPDVMPAYRANLKSEGCLLSIAAGFSLKSLASIFPGQATVRVMPNLPALIGAAATGLFANRHVSDAQRGLISRLIEATGKAVWVSSEDELDRLTAVSGSGPGYVFQFMESFMEAAEELGFSEEDARTLVVQTTLGAAQMASETDREIKDLRTSVTSKGGTTAAGLAQLRDDNALGVLMKNTTQAAYGRALELQ